MKLDNLFRKISLCGSRAKCFFSAAAMLVAVHAGVQAQVLDYSTNFESGFSGANGSMTHSNNAGRSGLNNNGFYTYTNGCNSYSSGCNVIHVLNKAGYRKSGDRCILFPAMNNSSVGTEFILELPDFSSQEVVSNLVLEFFMGTQSNSVGFMEIGYLTAYDGSDFVPLDTVRADAQSYCPSAGVQTTRGRTVTVRLSGAPSTARSLALRWNNEGNANAACCIDDLSVSRAASCPSVANLAVASSDYTSATVTWSEMGIATQWQVSLDGGSPVTVNTTPTYTFTGLTPGSSHSVSVEAVCGSETASPVDLSFSTPGCDAVTGLVAAPGYDVATISWNAGNGTQWQVSLDGGTPVTVTSPTYTFTGLTPNTSYTASVRTVCASTYFSDFVTVTFLPGCKQPTDFAATDVTGGSLSLAWTGMASQYEVQIATNNNFTAGLQTQTVSTASATFPGLEIGAMYYARVRAKCGSDVSNWSNTLSVRITDIPATGLYSATKTVVLNDLEDHSWSYYSDPTSPAPLHSYNPADVKIVYFGNGSTNVSTSTDDNPALSTFTAPSVSSISEGAAVGISEQDRQYDRFDYYQTLERVDGKTAANPSSATGRCPYRTIFNPFSLRPVYGTELPATTAKSNCRGWSGWRGFYVWRLKSVSEGAVYRSETGGTPLAVGDTVGADVQLYFQPDAEYGMTVEFEALWAYAYVTIAYNSYGMGTGSDASRGVYITNVGVERNFCVLQDYNTYIFQRRGSSGRYIADVNSNFPTVPVTYTSVLPNGTTNGTTKAYAAADNTTLNIGISSANGTSYNIMDLPVRCHADTKFEYLRVSRGNRGDQMHGQQWVADGSFSADGYNLTFGRGMKRQNNAHDYMINFVWGIGRILPFGCTSASQHGTYNGKSITCHPNSCSDPYHNAGHENRAYDQIQYYDSRYVGSNYGGKSASDADPSKSLNYTMRLETGYYNYPTLIYGFNRFYSPFGEGDVTRRNVLGSTEAVHDQTSHPARVWVMGEDNKVRLIIGNDYDRAREDHALSDPINAKWTPAEAKDSCSLRISVPFRVGNYWIRMPNQDQTKVFSQCIIKSGFIGYRMWRRRYDSSFSGFYAGGNINPDPAHPNWEYNINGDGGSNVNGSLPGGFGDGGTDGDPKSIYGGVSNDLNDFKGKRYMLIEGGYLYTNVSGCAWDTMMTNRDDNDVSVIRMKGGNIFGSVFGTTNTYAPGAGGRQLIMTGGKVWGWMSGGPNGTYMEGDGRIQAFHLGSTYIYAGGNFKLGDDTTYRRVGTYVNSRGWTGANDGNLFGAGCGIKAYHKDRIAEFNENAWKYHRAGEVWNTTVVVADQADILYDVYGGGNYGFVKPGYRSDVRILGGHVGGKVFGGSNNKTSGASNILMTGGLVEQGIYGGCNNWGVLKGDVNINVLGGTIGSDAHPNAGVYGGGYGQNTATSGNITVNIGDSTTWTGPTVFGDVYGGSQMGMVLGGDTVNTETLSTVYAGQPVLVVDIDTAGRYSDTRRGTVNYYGGDVRGDIYGGGYGQNAMSATSYGDVFVRILGSGANNVYGANNESGNPMGKVLVTIGSTDSLATDRNLPQVNGNVYGGGNMAAYGTHASTTTLTVKMFSGTVQKNVFGGGRGTTAVVNLPSGHAGLSNGHATEVFIKDGSVRGNVYGGGNAAKVIGDTHVEIGD